MTVARQPKVRPALSVYEYAMRQVGCLRLLRVGVDADIRRAGI
jgi:hypothetical protein